jgi:AraC-like DNA-binding protein
MNSILHHERAGEIAAFLRARCEAGDRDGIDIVSLCTRFTTSPTVLSRAFRNRYRCTVRAFIIRERVVIAKRLLMDGRLSVSEVAARVGYTSLTNFSRDFSKATGFSPVAWRKRTWAVSAAL